jgi:flagella basal body P-ring formation protein FlgA
MPAPHIHLPRQISLEDSDVQLGQICVIRGPADWVSRAQQVPLGKIYNPSKTLTFTRAQILSRLACCGLQEKTIRVTGARQIEVSRLATCIQSEELVGLARRYARQHVPTQSLCTLELIRVPQDLKIGQVDGPFQLVPRLQGNISTSQMRIRIAVVAQGKERAHRDIIFRLKHQKQVLVATETLTEGQTVTAENTRIEKRPSPLPQPPHWQPPYGQRVQGTIQAGADIPAVTLVPPAPSVTLKRNDLVVVRIQRPGLLISVTGKALDQGQTGDEIRVQNIESNQVIACRILRDGSVTPIM